MKRNLLNFLLPALALVAGGCDPISENLDASTPAIGFSESSTSLYLDPSNKPTSYTTQIVSSMSFVEDVIIYVDAAGDNSSTLTAPESVTLEAGSKSVDFTVELSGDVQSGDSFTATIAAGEGFNLQAGKSSFTLTTTDVEPNASVAIALTDGNKFNPYYAQIPVELTLSAAYSADITVTLTTTSTEFENFTVGSSDGKSVTIAAGQTAVQTTINAPQIDNVGFYRPGVTFALATSGDYDVDSSNGSVAVLMSDQQVNMSVLFTTIFNSATSPVNYRFYSRIMNSTTDESGTLGHSWTSAPSTIALNQHPTKTNSLYMVPFEYSLYVGSNGGYTYYSRGGGRDSYGLRTIFTPITTIFPDGDYVMAEYGLTDVLRIFSDMGEYIRFVPNPDDATKGLISAPENQTTSINYGEKTVWNGESTSTSAETPWVVDSVTNNGDVSKSTLPIAGTITVTIAKIEGTYDFSKNNSTDQCSMIFKVWMKSDSEYFKTGVESAIDSKSLWYEKDGDCYVFQYKMYAY